MPLNPLKLVSILTLLIITASYFGRFVDSSKESFSLDDKDGQRADSSLEADRWTHCTRIAAGLEKQHEIQN